MRHAIVGAWRGNLRVGGLTGLEPFVRGSLCGGEHLMRYDG
jgi:hypothetical protein